MQRGRSENVQSSNRNEGNPPCLVDCVFVSGSHALHAPDSVEKASKRRISESPKDR